MLFSHFRSGRVVPTPPSPAVITTLPSSIAYAEARGVRRMIEGYTGNLFKLYCATGTPGTLLEVAQDADGLPDMSGVAAWSGGSTAIYFDGFYCQVSGDYIAATTSTKRPLYIADADENGFPALTFGWDASDTVTLAQGLPSDTISVDRNNVGIFLVARSMSVGSNWAGQFASLNTSAPASVFSMGCLTGNRYTLYTFGSQNGFTNTFPPTNKLAILGYVGSAGSTKLHVDSRVTTTTANSSSAAVLTYWGKNTTSTAGSMMDSLGIVTTAAAPSDSEADAIKTALDTMFSIGITTTRKNMMIVTPHSLCWNANTGVQNQTVWKQMMPSITKQLEVAFVGANGRRIEQQAQTSPTNNLLDLTRCYEPSLDRFIYYLGSPVNDANGLANGFANGDSAIITSSANTIYNRYVSLKNTLIAQGSNVRIIVATAWQPVSTWWNGSTQDRTDRAQVLTEVNQLLRDNAVAEGWSVSDEATINTSGALGDTVHTNRVGEGRRAAVVAPVVEALLVA